MSKSWKPKNWEEVCKRNAGRRKLHVRKQEARAGRIVKLLSNLSLSEALCQSSYRRLPGDCNRSRSKPGHGFARSCPLPTNSRSVLANVRPTLRTADGSDWLVAGSVALLLLND